MRVVYATVPKETGILLILELEHEKAAWLHDNGKVEIGDIYDVLFDDSTGWIVLR